MLNFASNQVPKKRTTLRSRIQFEPTFPDNLITKQKEIKNKNNGNLEKREQMQVMGNTSSSADFMAIGTHKRKIPAMAMAVLRLQYLGLQL